VNPKTLETELANKLTHRHLYYQQAKITVEGDDIKVSDILNALNKIKK
jgi:hypothetical protein